MRPSVDHLARFVRDQRGAATVEYVALAAAACAVALASSDVVSGGMRGLAGTVDSEFRQEPAEALAGISYSDGFENGATGWIGALASKIPGIGNGYVLGPIAGTGAGGPARITRDFQIDPNAAQATFDFSLYAVDNLQNESGIIYIDGVEVGRMTSDQGIAVFTAAADLKARGITLRATEIDNNINLGGNATYRDALSSISITIDKPADRVTFGFGSTASQDATDRSFAIEDFEATGLKNSAS